MPEQRFAYHRAVAPSMWMMVALCGLELAVVHPVASLFLGRAMAIGLSLLSAAAIGWIVAAIVSMKRRPVLLDDERLVMRVGTIKSVSVPRDLVAGLRPAWSASDLKGGGVLKLSLVAYPNVLVDLAAPLPGRRGIRAIAHRLDDPAAFAEAIEPLRRADDR